jgi:predicted nucleotidyltransferase
VTSPTGSSPGPDGIDPLAEYARLLERVDSVPAVVGIVVFGSRAVGADLTPGSDVDCFVIVDGSVDEAAGWKMPYGGPVETWPITLEAFRTHALPGDEAAWNRAAFIRARVDVDRLDGEITAIVDRKRRLTADEAKAIVEANLDDAINSIYRALKSAEAARVRQARLDAIEAIAPMLTTVFALERRVRPFNRWLEHDLALEPLAMPAVADLLARVDALAVEATPDTIRSAFRMLEAAARDAGYGAIVDSWEPYVGWLRGETGYRGD